METVPVAAGVVHDNSCVSGCAVPCAVHPLPVGPAAPGWAALSACAAHLHARVAPQRQVSVAEMGSGWQGAEQSRRLCAGSPNVTHGDWQVETKTQSFTRREKNKGIEMK